jgi:tRNA(Ile)-lysidine synthase
VRTADLASAITVTEAKSLFDDLKSIPALVLAVSGGPDSTALMVLAARWRGALKSGPKLIAVTVDHGLRKEAKREAADVARLARKLGIAHRTMRWSGRKPKTGLQQAARAARYKLLGEAARRAGASHILTAHTLDDQAETVLIRMTRGSGVTGLAAMQRTTMLDPSLSSPSPERGGSDRRRRSGVGSTHDQSTPTRRASRVDLPLAGGGMELVLVRPLLDIPKSRLIATLRAADIAFADDPSNRDPRFTRARLRGLMPQLAAEGLDAGRLALLARRLRRSDAAIEAAVDAASAALAPAPASSAGHIYDATGFAGLPDEIALRLLGRAVAAVGDEGPVELAKLEALKAALDTALDAGNRWRRSLAGALVTLSGGKIVVERAPPRRAAVSKALTKGRPAKARGSKRR